MVMGSSFLSVEATEFPFPKLMFIMFILGTKLEVIPKGYLSDTPCGPLLCFCIPDNYIASGAQVACQLDAEAKAAN